MNLLLDTHVLLWALTDDKRLKPAARIAIEDPSAIVYVSAASAWEIAIKAGLGRIRLSGNPAKWLPVELARADFTELPVSMEHAFAVERLPRHHGDPFDRLLVAQAQIEGLALATADRKIGRYDVRILRC